MLRRFRKRALKYTAKFALLLLIMVTTFGTTGNEAQAQLKLEKTEVSLQAKVEDQWVEAEFGFINVGSKPVSILAVEPVCGCTTATMEKTAFNPGERGSVKARFTFGDRVGLQVKTVDVHTDSKADSDVRLTMKVTIPELLKADPPMLIWNVNSPSAPMTMTLMPGTDKPVNVLGIEVPDPNLSATLRTITPGKEYQISVTPKNLSRPFFGVIHINIQGPDGKPRCLNKFARIGDTVDP